MAFTIRTDENQDEKIAQLCSKLDIKAATKLFFYLLNDYEVSQEKIRSLERDKYQLQRDLSDTNHVVEDFQGSITNLLNFKVR